MTTREKEIIGEEIRAMDTLARCVNDEYLFETWLMYGVADGDCESMNNIELYEYYYEDNEENFKEIVEVFRNIIKVTDKHGLYIGDVVA